MPGIRKRFFAWMLNKGEPVNDRLSSGWKRDLFKDIKGTIVEIGPARALILIISKKH